MKGVIVGIVGADGDPPEVPLDSNRMLRDDRHRPLRRSYMPQTLIVARFFYVSAYGA